LLGKYYLGVKPTSAGYATYVVEPVLGGLQWMEGKVPTPNGNISVNCSNKQMKIKGDEGTGTLRFKSKKKPRCKDATIVAKGEGVYEITIEPGKEYIVNYISVPEPHQPGTVNNKEKKNGKKI
jgi:hypothetical protein